MPLRLSLLLALLSLLSACTTPLDRGIIGNPDFQLHQQALLAHPDWQLDGRLNVRQAQSSDTVSLRWLQRDQHFDLTLRGTLIPLGSTHVFGTPTGLTVEKAGEEPLQLPNLQALSQQYLNFEFPADHLQFWVRGLPVPDLQTQASFADNNLLTELTQVDSQRRRWVLQYDRYQQVDGMPLPGRIRLVAGAVQLTFLVSDWQLSPP